MNSGEQAEEKERQFYSRQHLKMEEKYILQLDRYRKRYEKLEEDLAACKSHKKSYWEELVAISDCVPPGEDDRNMTHQGSLLQRVEDTLAQLEYLENLAIKLAGYLRRYMNVSRTNITVQPHEEEEMAETLRVFEGKPRENKNGSKDEDDTQMYVVRLWDGMDGIWMDVSKPASRKEAEKIYNEKTANGTKNTRYEDIDYYGVFPADTTMRYSYEADSNGMFR